MSFQIQINLKTRNTLFNIINWILWAIVPVGILLYNFVPKNKNEINHQFLVIFIHFCVFILTVLVLLFLLIFTKDKENE
jgi:hypothetical protein